jgi:hypothetical protein
MGLSDVRTDHHLKRCRASRPPVARGLPTLRQRTVSHVPFPLPRWTAMGACVGASPSRGSLPPIRAESASTSRTFEACSGFTRITARRIARCTTVHLLSPRLQRAELPPLAARIATELYRHLLGWNLHPLVLCAFVAHPNGLALTRGRSATAQRPSGAAPVRLLLGIDRVHC